MIATTRAAGSRGRFARHRLAAFAGSALLILVALSAAACQGAPTCPGDEASATCTHVLFLGNSYTYVNDLPNTFDQLAWSGGHRVQVGMVANGGETLDQHASAPETQDMIASQHWDYVVLQEQSEAPAVAGSRDYSFFPAARNLVARVRTAGAAPIFFMTWGHRDGLPSSGLPDFEAMQYALADGYLEIAHELGVPVAPVGSVWDSVRHDHPDIALWQDDGSHPTAAGTYLAACVFYAAFFRQSPEGLGYHGGIADDQARALQTEADDHVVKLASQWGL